VLAKRVKSDTASLKQNLFLSTQTQFLAKCVLAMPSGDSCRVLASADMRRQRHRSLRILPD
jgi:hypothetical protein